MPPQVNPNLLGRDTRANVKHIDRVVAAVGAFVLPRRLAAAPRPKASPNNAKYWNRRYCGQELGDCTGEANANAAQTLLRMPPGRTAASTPLPRKDLSALWAYYNGRILAKSQGIDFGGDGCIGSLVAYAAQKTGFTSIENYPPTPANYKDYSDDVRPPAACFTEGPHHCYGEVKILQSFEDVLALLAGGWVVPVGTDVTEGMMTCDKGGWWRMTGQVVGGHEYCLVDFNETEDWIDIGNSWANAEWGLKEDHPDQDPACHGYNNIGRTYLSEYARLWTPAHISSGASEALAVNTVAGWAPKASDTFEGVY
jgi:hypothetical protein